MKTTIGKTRWVALATLFCSLIAPMLASAGNPALPGMAEVMERELAAKHTAGVVTLVMKNGELRHLAAEGYADQEKRKPMRTDSVFWIASMTKSISATAILTLVDEGKLSLDEPVSQWLPVAGKVKLANGEPPARPINLRDLMSHTSGLAFPPRKPTDGAITLKAYADTLLKAPLEFEPGSNYRYGFGLTVAGRIAEIVSGKTFDRLMRERVLDPLGMKDTTFHPEDRLRRRIAHSYKTSEDGKSLLRGYNPFVTSDAGVRRMTEPSGGLFSTASDIARFYQMILDGGVHQGRRIVSEKAIAEMTKPHTAGDRLLNYGLGWMCNNPERQPIKGFSSDSYGHGGAFATHGWVDPENRIVTVLMVQNVLVRGSRDVRNAFHKQVTSALVK